MYLIVVPSGHCKHCRALLNHCTVQPQTSGCRYFVVIWLTNVLWLAAIDALIELIIIKMTIIRKDLPLLSYIYIYLHI